jgi:hypothetical protein
VIQSTTEAMQASMRFSSFLVMMKQLAGSFDFPGKTFCGTTLPPPSEMSESSPPHLKNSLKYFVGMSCTRIRDVNLTNGRAHVDGAVVARGPQRWAW